MTTNFNWEGYWAWLMDIVKIPSDYSKLGNFLANEQFTWINPMDGNRADDGIDMRLAYARECGLPIITDDIYNEMNCSVLEMLVALCCRIERDITGTPGDDHPEKWFWEFMHNLRIDAESDDIFDENYVSLVIDTWLNRGFKRNGVGSPFPLRRAFGDQRRKEIWNQAQSYLIENLEQEE